MKITIYQNREVYKEESKIGNDSENKVETLEFEFPEEYADFTKYIEFQIKGEKYVDLIEGNKYVITREVAKYGKIKTQVVLKKNTENDVMVFKSDIFTLNVSNSINATENLVNTVGIDLIEKIVGKNYEQDVRLDTLEADNTTNKEIISNLQNDNTTNKTNIKSLQDDNETNKTDISNIKQEQTIQNTNIQKNTYDITGIKEKDTTQDSLIEQLQAENTKLKKEINSMQIPGEATGNPIHLSDSSDMECEIVPIGGAGQETREGYNLLIPPATQTKNGITFTVNDDNSITVNGTAKANASINFVNSSGSTMLSFEAGTYKLTGCPEGGSNTTYRMGMNLNGDNFDAGDGAIITTSEDVTNKVVWLIVYKGTTVSNLTFYPMLIKGTEDKPYEPYGASPSPDYPSEIVTVGSNINLCNGINQGYYLNFETYLCGLLSENNGLIIPITGGKYTISTQINQTRYRVACINEKPIEGKTVTAYKGVNKDGTSNNITIDTSGYAYLIINATDLTKIKIEKGSKATPYSPYGQGSVEINVCNKNEFDKEKITTSRFIDAKGNITNVANWDSYLVPIKVKQNTKYTLSRDKSKTNESQFIIAEYKKDGTFIRNNALWQNGTYKHTITTTNETDYVYLGYRNDFDHTDLQFELGEDRTDYIPHESYAKVLPIQKEFVKIGDYEDTFVKVDGKWYEQHTIEKLILDGAENYTVNTTTDIYTEFLTDVIENIRTNSNLYCNYLLNGSYLNSCLNGVTSSSKIRVRFENSILGITTGDDTNTKISKFKTWLQEKYNNGNPVIVYYVLQEPELIECTAEQESILNSFYTYKGITNISVDGIGTLKVNYKKDLETLFNNINSALLS